MPEMQTQEAPRLEARFAPATFNADTATVELSWGRGSEVERYDWRTEQRYTEVLAMDPAAVDLSRLQGGAPLLDTHSRYSLDGVLGVVERAWLVNGEGRAIVRFSTRDDVKPILRDVQDGIIRNVSVGYTVEEWKTERGPDGAMIRRAVRWTPSEISLVPVPADASAQVRAADDAAASRSGVPNHQTEGRMAEDITGPASPAPTAAPTPPANDAATREQATRDERTRIASLDAPLNTARSAGLPDAALGALRTRGIEEGWDAQRLQSELFGALAAREQRDQQADTFNAGSPPMPPTAVSQFGRSGEDPTGMARAMGHALAVHAMPALASSEGIDPRFREFANLRPSDMLLELANARGERVSPRDRHKLIDRMFSRSFHTTSDFPLLLEAASNKMLEAGYALADPSYRRFFAQKSFRDFKAHKFLTVGDFPALEKVPEGGAISAGTISEKRESVTPTTYARQIRVTRQMLINDDLGAFTDFSGMIGRRVAYDENALAYALVNTASGAGPTLVEGNAAVFTTGRTNRAASGGAIAEATLDTAYAAMMGITSLDGLKLNIAPRVLLTGAAYRGAALRYTARISPESGANVGLYSDLTPISDANITGNRWYLFADPGLAPVYVYGYVNGQSAPMVRVHQYVPGTDGIAVELVHDFGVGAIDFRGGYFNPGA
jgi:hypothetical protein